MEPSIVEEIKRAIEALAPEERGELYLRFEERYLDASDAQLKAALDAGDFDDQIERAIADDKAGRTKSLEEVLRDPRLKNE